MSNSKNKSKITLTATTDSEKDDATAKAYLSPLVMTSNVIRNFYTSENLNLLSIMRALREYSEEAVKDDLKSVELMLLAQTQLLNTIFIKAATRLSHAETMTQYQIYSNVALKAQNLCRMTAATLADMKNPNRTTFIKNTAVNQQINLGSENSAKPSNELLSEAKDATMDTRGTQTPIRVDKEMATVG
jgi:hypothetical protein